MNFTKMTIYILNNDFYKYTDIHDILKKEFTDFKLYGWDNKCYCDDNLVSLELNVKYITISALEFNNKPEVFEKLKKIANNYISFIVYENDSNIVDISVTEHDKYRDFVGVYMVLMMRENYTQEKMIETLYFIYKYKDSIYEFKDVLKNI